ncbi:ATP-binding protein [Actinomadura xylanilytica]|uniref:ATP-binding protein n=1 Tax=Actinomadura xylanilytica TaxID=887459 RepID=UPI00255AC152|nr:ATP-binding protein [Actinomadura xylanilytica]MDL4774792.1 ATP-binding protein [Actinomadura xylanilytica]
MMVTATGNLIFRLLGTPAAVGLARSITDARLCKWDCLHILDDALLVVSELVTNATRQTPYEEIRFQIVRDSPGIVIAVWDSSPDLPQPKPITELTLEDLDLSEEAFDDNGGWGLPIVQALSSKCGITRDPGGGKWTWARLVA